MSKPYEPKPKTERQRDALHLGFTWLADHLNETGNDMRVVLKPHVAIPWSKKNVKQFLFKPLLKAYTGKESTEDMTKDEPGMVWDIMMKHLAETRGIEYVPFPSQTQINHESDAKNMANKLRQQEDYPTYEEPLL